MEAMDLYIKYAEKCRSMGLEPLSLEQWSGERFSSERLIPKINQEGVEVTKQEAAKILGYKNAAPVSNAIRNGYLKEDGNGGVTEESVMEYKKKKKADGRHGVVWVKGMNSEKYDSIPDDGTIAMTKKTFEKVIEIKVAEAVKEAEERMKKEIVFLEISDITGSGNE